MEYLDAFVPGKPFQKFRVVARRYHRDIMFLLRQIPGESQRRTEGIGIGFVMRDDEHLAGRLEEFLKGRKTTHGVLCELRGKNGEIFSVRGIFSRLAQGNGRLLSFFLILRAHFIKAAYMAGNRTFTMIKPDAVEAKNTGAIIKMIE